MYAVGGAICCRSPLCCAAVLVRGDSLCSHSLVYTSFDVNHTESSRPRSPAEEAIFG